MKEIYNDTYCQKLYIVHGEPEEILKFLEKSYGHPVPATFDKAELGWVETFGVRVVIYLHKLDKSNETLSTIMHESVHAASQVFKIRGIEHDLDNEEPYAYLVDWIVRQILGVIDEHNAE